MELKLAVVFIVVGALGIISAPFVLTTKEFSNGFEFYYTRIMKRYSKIHTDTILTDSCIRII